MTTAYLEKLKKDQKPCGVCKFNKTCPFPNPDSLVNEFLICPIKMPENMYDHLYILKDRAKFLSTVHIN